MQIVEGNNTISEFQRGRRINAFLSTINLMCTHVRLVDKYASRIIPIHHCEKAYRETGSNDVRNRARQQGHYADHIAGGKIATVRFCVPCSIRR